MVRLKNISYLLLAVQISCTVNQKIPDTATQKTYNEKYRPQLHFSPQANWMNDPNGMVYYDGEYHLFYQHYPEGDVWGPMHWGHAVSNDLLHWQHLPVALFPDSLGMIFSGSAVVDEKNTSGLGTMGNPPMVAIFTYHFMEGEKQGRNDYQSQGLAYSLDKGRTWIKYKNNPVVKNPGIKDFRDPKVFWHEPSGKWIMILAVLDHVEFYGSQDLKEWNKLSDFGKDYGSHGGVWECPDLFALYAEGDLKPKWVMLLSINPGGPNGGSGTQYFLGNFDGKNFISETKKEDTLWVDYGADDYAGVTWSGIPREDGRRIFLGWMSNWNYANVVPTNPWRSAMTIPRTLTLQKINDRIYLKSHPVHEVEKLTRVSKTFSNIEVKDSVDLSGQLDSAFTLAVISGTVEAKDFLMELSNDNNEKVLVGYDAAAKRYYVDRSNSGNKDFAKNFNPVSFAPRIVDGDNIKFTMITDVSSVEVFFDDGITNLTNLFFPSSNFNRLKIRSRTSPVKFESLTVKQLRSVW